MNLSLRPSDKVAFVCDNQHAIAMIEGQTLTFHALKNEEERQVIRDFLKQENVSYEKEE